MSGKVHFVVSFSVIPGKLGDFERIAQQMIAATRKESGALAYDWFMDREKQNCRLLETYTDAEAVTAHINGEAVQVFIPQLLQSASIADFQVYGEPGAGRDALAEMRAQIFSSWKVFKD